MSLSIYYNQNVIVTEHKFGNKVTIESINNTNVVKIDNRPIEEIDLVTNKTLSNLDVHNLKLDDVKLYVYCCNDGIYLNKVYIKSTKNYINNRSNLSYYCKLYGIRLPKLIFSGKLTDKISLPEKFFINCNNKNHTVYNYTQNEYTQIISNDLINTIYDIDFSIIPLFKNQAQLRVIELNNYIFLEIARTFEDVNTLTDNFNIDLNYEKIDNSRVIDYFEYNVKYKILYKMIISLFRTNKVVWSGYFYTSYFVKRIETIKKRISEKTKTKTMNVFTNNYM